MGEIFSIVFEKWKVQYTSIENTCIGACIFIARYLEVKRKAYGMLKRVRSDLGVKWWKRE
jgi:hypothetical protein